jgi:beta-glucanase (GH16 family)
MQTAFTLIDPDTPQDAYTRPGVENPSDTMELVFSDEFNVVGRTFYPGDDPFWEAVDLWYWPTFDLEWYDPQQVTTEDGYLKITIDKVENHGMEYISGMVTTWNKFCFTGGLIEGMYSRAFNLDANLIWVSSLCIATWSAKCIWFLAR